jgi:hypothetical protein
LTGQSQGTNIVTYIVLVDGGNVIKFKSLNSTTIDNVTVGSYKAVAITWDNSQANAPVVEVGLNLNNVDHCWKSTAVDMSICDCNTTTNSITVPISTGVKSSICIDQWERSDSVDSIFNNFLWFKQ